MSVNVGALLSRHEVMKRLSGMLATEHVQTFEQCLRASEHIWHGEVDGVLVCVWGLIPPTLMSEQAYLWLYTTDALKGNEFLFVRHSQVQIQKMLESYPRIIGHARPENESGNRWLKWLGAEFHEPIGPLIPFTIRRRHG